MPPAPLDPARRQRDLAGGLALAGLGHQVTFAYLPYSKFHLPVSPAGLRRQDRYTRSVLRPARGIIERAYGEACWLWGRTQVRGGASPVESGCRPDNVPYAKLVLIRHAACRTQMRKSPTKELSVPGTVEDGETWQTGPCDSLQEVSCNRSAITAMVL